VVAGDGAEDDSDGKCHRGGDEAEQKGDAGAMGDAGGDVSPQRVRAQEEAHLAGAAEGRAGDLPRVVGEQERGEQGEGDDEGQHGGADQGALVAGEAAQEILHAPSSMRGSTMV
jgi:hypothetical protein